MPFRQPLDCENDGPFSCFQGGRGIEREILRLIGDKGPLTGAELLDALGGKSLALWKACRTSQALQVRTVGRRYLRLDRMVEDYARLSPSILREFMTYAVVGTLGQEEALEQRVQGLVAHTGRVSQSKMALARGLLEKIESSLAEQWPHQGRICFIIAGDIAYGMAHDVSRPERSLGKLVNGSDIDLIVVGDDAVPKEFLRALDKAIHWEKYLALIMPHFREEIDYVVKDMDRVREQLQFDTFKRKVACKILGEGVFLGGSGSLFQELKSLLSRQGIVARLQEMEESAKSFRLRAEERLLGSDAHSLKKEELHLFYTTEESEEFE